MDGRTDGRGKFGFGFSFFGFPFFSFRPLPSCACTRPRPEHLPKRNMVEQKQVVNMHTFNFNLYFFNEKSSERVHASLCLFSFLSFLQGWGLLHHGAMKRKHEMLKRILEWGEAKRSVEVCK
mgnify:CR=1 FL=1